MAISSNLTSWSVCNQATFSVQWSVVWTNRWSDYGLASWPSIGERLHVPPRRETHSCSLMPHLHRRYIDDTLARMRNTAANKSNKHESLSFRCKKTYGQISIRLSRHFNMWFSMNWITLKRLQEKRAHNFPIIKQCVL